MGFFSLDSSQWELSESLQPIFSISYRFWDTRGQRGQKCDFWGHIKFLFFIQFWWDFFFIGFLSMRAFRIVSADFLLSLKTYHFSQTHYCVKQVLEAYLFICTLLLSTCCGRIMLRLRSPSVNMMDLNLKLTNFIW